MKKKKSARKRQAVRVASLQTKIDSIIDILGKFESNRKIPLETKVQIRRVCRKLRRISRELPELVKSERKLRLVFTALGKGVELWRRIRR